MRTYGLVGLMMAVGCFAEPPQVGSDGVSTNTAMMSTGAALTTTISAGLTMDSAGSSANGTSGGQATGGGTNGADTETSDTTGTGSTSDTGGASSQGSTTDIVLLVEDAEVGDLVITEVMVNPDCSKGVEPCEWFELFNTSESSFDLEGLQVYDNGSFTGGQVGSEVVIGPGQFVVLARLAQGWPYVFDYDGLYGPDPALNNNAPELLRIDTPSGRTLDQTGFISSVLAGRTFSLLPGAMDVVSNDDSENWCDSATPLPHDGSVDQFGTPHAMTGDCF